MRSGWLLRRGELAGSKIEERCVSFFVFNERETMNIFRSYCLCTFVALCNRGGVASAQIVEIPDTNLQNAVRQALTLPDESPITQADMLSLVELEIWRTSPVPIAEQIADLTGLQHAVNLRSLVLPKNNISDP